MRLSLSEKKKKGKNMNLFDGEYFLESNGETIEYKKLT